MTLVFWTSVLMIPWMSAEATLQETLQQLGATHQELLRTRELVHSGMLRVLQLETEIRAQVGTLLQEIHQERYLSFEQIRETLQVRLHAESVSIQHAAGLLNLPLQEPLRATHVPAMSSRLEWREWVLLQVPYAGNFWGSDETIMRDEVTRASIRSIQALEKRFQGQEWIRAFRELDDSLRTLAPVSVGLEEDVHAAAVRALDYIAALVPPMTEMCLYHGLLAPNGIQLLRIEELLGILWLASQEVEYPETSKIALYKALASSQMAHNGSTFFGTPDALDQPSCPKGFFIRALEALDHVHPLISLGQLEAHPTSAQIAEAIREIIHSQLLQELEGLSLRQAAQAHEGLFFAQDGPLFRTALLQALASRFPLVSIEVLETFLGQEEVRTYAQYFVDMVSEVSSVDSQI
jgi:hypothetical protein